MPKSSKPGRPGRPPGSKGARKPTATTEGGTKPWRERGRLALLDLEPAVERMLLMGCSVATIHAYCQKQRGEVEVGAAQVAGMIKGIRARWMACEDQTRQERVAEFAAQLDAAIHDAWNRPVMIRTEAGPEPLLAQDGTAVTQVDLNALAKLLKLKAELRGLNAPAKHVHLHSDLPPPAALSPVERQEEIARLLAKRDQALAAARLPGPLPLAGPVIDVPVSAHMELDAEAK